MVWQLTVQRMKFANKVQTLAGTVRIHFALIPLGKT